MPGDKYLISVGNTLRVWDISVYARTKSELTKIMHTLNNSLTFAEMYLLHKIETAWKKSSDYKMPKNMAYAYESLIQKMEKLCSLETILLIKEILNPYVPANIKT